MTNANEEEVTIDNDEFTETTTETTEESESQNSGSEADETVTLNKSDYEKLKREVAANARLREKAKERSQKSDDKGEEGSQLDRDLIDRTYLAAQAGVKDMDVQDEALRLAKKFGMTVVEALKDADISSRLENLQKKKKAQAAIAGSTGGAKVANKGMDYYVAEFKSKGTLPDDPKIVAKMMDYLV
jgi:hypothetical protein